MRSRAAGALTPPRPWARPPPPPCLPAQTPVRRFGCSGPQSVGPALPSRPAGVAHGQHRRVGVVHHVQRGGEGMQHRPGEAGWAGRGMRMHGGAPQVGWGATPGLALTSVSSSQSRRLPSGNTRCFTPGEKGGKQARGGSGCARSRQGHGALQPQAGGRRRRATRTRAARRQRLLLEPADGQHLAGEGHLACAELGGGRGSITGAVGRQAPLLAPHSHS